jgi:hypothetical protein
MADASAPDTDGWQRVSVDPRVMPARVAGLNSGFLVLDDPGLEWTRSGETFALRPFPNRFVYSREQNRASAPYFTVEVGPDDRQPPAAPSGLEGRSSIPAGTRSRAPRAALAVLPAGQALVSWVTPRDSGPAGTLGFSVEVDGHALPHELIPMAGSPGGRVEMNWRDLKLSPGATVKLSVRAVDGAGNLGPAATADLRVSDGLPAPLPPLKSSFAPSRAAMPGRLPYLGTAAAPTAVAILDELDKVHPVTGELYLTRS